jgi:hypothetical protein
VPASPAPGLTAPAGHWVRLSYTLIGHPRQSQEDHTGPGPITHRLLRKPSRSTVAVTGDTITVTTVTGKRVVLLPRLPGPHQHHHTGQQRAQPVPLQPQHRDQPHGAVRAVGRRPVRSAQGAG